MGTDKGVVVDDGLLEASGLPFAVLLGIVLKVEVTEGDRLGVFLLPAVKFRDALHVLLFFILCGSCHHNAFHYADVYNYTEAYVSPW